MNERFYQKTDEELVEERATVPTESDLTLEQIASRLVTEGKIDEASAAELLSYGEGEDYGGER